MSETLVKNLKEAAYFNTGKGPNFQILDIGHEDYFCLVDPDTAFWALSRKDEVGQLIGNEEFTGNYLEKAEDFHKEMDYLRFGLKPSAVYFNPTDLCNLNCKYCYIPHDIRKNGENMSEERLKEALGILKDYFSRTIPDARLPQIIFHGAEPLMNKKALFAAIDEYREDFLFGLQTNATLLEADDIEFLKRHEVAVGVSLDGHVEQIADRTRLNWEGEGSYAKVVSVIEAFKGYKRFSVICTLTKENIENAVDMVEFFHGHRVETCLLNILRCTQDYSRELKPDEDEAAGHFIKALERSHELYNETGHKLVVANFANILLSVVAPAARRLMCDISPCGGGRCFFAVSASGDLFPCSEFIGLEEFNSGNIFKDKIEDILETEPVRKVTTRLVENIDPCKRCAIRHFCGSPCPAEAFNMNGGRDELGAFCRFYEEQTRYVFRLIADGKHEDFLYDNWDKETEDSFDWSAFGKK